MRWTILFVFTLIVLVSGCSNEPANLLSSQAGGASQSALGAGSHGKAVVANRSSGTISVIDAGTGTLAGTYDLPAEAGEPTPEPMYVVYVPQVQRVFVGDRANSRIAAFDASTYDVIGTVPTGAGVFHMWADPQGRQLWVNCDMDNTTTVIDPAGMTVMASVPTPADLVAEGGHPHDVILGPKGRFAYITVLGVAGEHDYVVQFDTATLQETERAAVGKDAHLSLSPLSPWLFVPCQDSDVVFVLDRMTLEFEREIPVPGAHGAGMTTNGRVFYTTNLPGPEPERLFAIDTRSLRVIGHGVSTPYAVPHNIALDPAATRLFLTHSGATSDKVTIYAFTRASAVPTYFSEVTVGLNPFGITFVP